MESAGSTMKSPTKIVTVNVNLTTAPVPSLPPPIPPDPDLMPAFWRIPQRIDKNWKWLYVRRGTDELWAEYALCDQHTRCLELWPPDEKELAYIKEISRPDA